MSDLKEKAVALREQGLTYQQISDALNGELSVHWLRRNIAKVSKGTYIEPMMEELIAEASKPQGCSNYKAYGIVFKHRTKKVSYDAMSGIKKKAKKLDPRCLFIPTWLDTNKPVEANILINAYAHELYETMQHLADSYMESFPNVRRNSVLREIVGLAYEDMLPEPLSIRLNRNMNNVEELMTRQENANYGAPFETLNGSHEDVSDKPYSVDNDVLTDKELDDIWLRDIPY